MTTFVISTEEKQCFGVPYFEGPEVEDTLTNAMS